jgi:putative glutamine amidotransferase
MTKTRIGVPLPTSTDLEYNRRSWPQYAAALASAQGEAVPFPLDASPAETARLATTCHAFLLPGSPADVNPEKYGQPRDPATAPPDLPRSNVDELLLQDAHNLYKPLLCICYGAQSLNVWRGGTLIQDLTTVPINHKAGASVAIAHTAAIVPDSVLAQRLSRTEIETVGEQARLPINSSHHQAIGIAGDKLRVVARSPQDGVVEAVEGGLAAEHFVLGLQWHPERSVEISATSRAIFDDFVRRASVWVPRSISISVG